jgi:hypothetical protein
MPDFQPPRLALCGKILLLAILNFANATNTVAQTNPDTQIIPNKMTNKPRINTLEVLGLGLTVEIFRQSEVLTEMDEQGDKSIIPQEQKYYVWGGLDRDEESRQRQAAALEHCISYFVRGWQIPSVTVTSKKSLNPAAGELAYTYDEVDRLRQPAGLHAHQSKQIRHIFEDLPEGILESAFQYFEHYPDVPAVILFVRDGLIAGNQYHKATDPTEAITAILLARRERVDAMRPYLRASTGPNAHKPVQPPGLPPYQPTQFLPQAWHDWQMKEFDALPTIGILHRPITVPYMKDKDGQPTSEPKLKKSMMSDNEKQLAFQAAWKKAMALLPQGKKQARVLYDHGDPSHGKDLVPLSLTLHLQDPNFDLFNPKQGYNIYRRLGDTGAASPFVMWGTGLIASYRNGDASVAVNLRDPNQATITVITPSGDKRKHPAGDPVDFGLAATFSDWPAPPAPGNIAEANHPSPSASTLPGQPLPDDFDPDATIPPEMAIPVLSAMAPAVPLGTTRHTGQTCPQSGIWRCAPADARYGADHPLRQGQSLPSIQIQQNRSLLQKMTGAPELVQVGASWTLIAHDTAQGDN